jgi:hypothetical protein
LTRVHPGHGKNKRFDGSQNPLHFRSLAHCQVIRAYRGNHVPINYTPHSVFFNNFVVVPEPAHVLLLCAAAAGVVWRVRRRRALPAGA